MGDFEASTQVEVESSVEYHPVIILILTLCCYLYFELVNANLDLQASYYVFLTLYMILIIF